MVRVSLCRPLQVSLCDGASLHMSVPAVASFKVVCDGASPPVSVSAVAGLVASYADVCDGASQSVSRLL